MRRKMWTVYGPAIRELFDGHLDAGETLHMRSILDRILQVAREHSP